MELTLLLDTSSLTLYLKPQSSPPPAKTFPDTALKWKKYIGRKLFSVEDVGMFTEGSEGEEEEEEDVYDIIRRESPTRFNITV